MKTFKEEVAEKDRTIAAFEPVYELVRLHWFILHDTYVWFTLIYFTWHICIVYVYDFAFTPYPKA